jgi:hypothetical protein
MTPESGRMTMNRVTHPRCESLWCRLGHWWQGLSHRRQNLVVAVATGLTIAAIALTVAALGSGQEAQWTWNIPG